MSIKTLYFDVETTGLDPRQNGIIQLACIIDIEGNIEAEHNWNVAPFENDKIDREALAVNGCTEEQIKGFDPPREVYEAFISVLGRFVDKYNRFDKFYPAGYNLQFDLDFENQWFIKNGDKYFGSWQNWNAIDPLAIIRRLVWMGILEPLPNYKLITVCEHFGIELGESAHDALADIRATRELNLILNKYFKTED